MQIAQAAHVIISHHCKVMVIGLCVRSKSNFLPGDKLYYTHWCNRFDMYFFSMVEIYDTMATNKTHSNKIGASEC